MDADLADAFAAQPGSRLTYRVLDAAHGRPVGPHLILAFQTRDDTRSGIALCRGAMQGRDAAGPIHILGVVCRDGRRYAEARAHIGKEVPMDDEEFRRLTGQTARALIAEAPRD